MRSALSVIPVAGYMNWQVSALEILERYARVVDSSKHVGRPVFLGPSFSATLMPVSQRKEITGHKKFRNGDLRSLYYTPDIHGMMKSRKKILAMRVAHMENIRDIEEPEGKSPLRRLKR